MDPGAMHSAKLAADAAGVGARFTLTLPPPRVAQSLLELCDVSKLTTCSSVKLVLLLDCCPITVI